MKDLYGYTDKRDGWTHYFPSPSDFVAWIKATGDKEENYEALGLCRVDEGRFRIRPPFTFSFTD